MSKVEVQIARNYKTAHLDDYEGESATIRDGFKPGFVGYSLHQQTVATTDETACFEEEISKGDMEEPFFICNLATATEQWNRWVNFFPAIDAFYAVKCNPDKKLTSKLAELGAGFDCASKTEIAFVLETGVAPSRIIFANPCKPASHIRFARNQGVSLMTFDNSSELVKIRKFYSDAQLILRIAVDDANSVYHLNAKFGAKTGQVDLLLQTAKSMGLNVVGVSFHVGSGCSDANQYRHAITAARVAFDKATRIGFKMNLLDLGGGFPGHDTDTISISEIASLIKESLETNFNQLEFPRLRIIAEPGRYFASAAFSLAVSITSKRVESSQYGSSSKSIMYYLNDGVYGSFSCVAFDHATLIKPIILTQHGRSVHKECINLPVNGLHPSTLWGPTCDSVDCVLKDVALPEVDVGDWLLFRNMGAYTMAAASSFNGFPRTNIIYLNG